MEIQPCCDTVMDPKGGEKRKNTRYGGIKKA